MVVRWEKVKAVERMQDFIDAHLQEQITLHALARAARYSPYHAARMFKELTGQSPFRYIRLMRMSAAARVLAEEKVRITDVAFDFVFDSHEGFTRAFARQFGMTPSEYRRTRAEVPLFSPGRVRDHYTNKQAGEETMTEESKKKKPEVVFVQIIERPERRLILKRGREAAHYFAYCEEVGCEVWEVLTRVEGALHEPMGMWLPDRFRTDGTSVYAQGVEVPADHAGDIPEGFEIIDLPAARLLVFQGPPFEDEKFEQAIESLWDVMNSYDPALIGYQWADDDAPRFQLEPTGYRGYIEGRPVRAT